MEALSNKDARWALAWLLLGGLTAANGVSKMGGETTLALLLLLMAFVFSLNTIKHFRRWRIKDD